MIPFSEFYSNVQGIAAPEGLGENLVPYFRNAVVNGLISVQTFIPCYRDLHVDFFTQEQTTDFCGCAVVNGPRGIINSVFAYEPGVDCRKLLYTRRTTEFIECWINETRCAQCPPSDPVRLNLYESPYCHVPTNAAYACDSVYVTTPEDDNCFRRRDRWFAVGPDYRLYLAPRFLCQHRLCIVWEGIKRCWTDTDGVMEDEDLTAAVARYAEAELSKKDGEFARMHEIMGSATIAPLGSYRALLRDMRHRCQQERRTPEARDCSPMIDSLVAATSTPLYLPYSQAPEVVC